MTAPESIPTVPATEPVAHRPLGAAEWALLRHPAEDARLSALWARIAPVLIALESLPQRALGLRPRDAVKADDPRPFAVACREAARLLGVPAPELHVRHDRRQPALFVNARSEHALTPAFLVGTSVLGDRRATSDLVFALGLRLARLVPERVLGLAIPDVATIALVLDAVIALSNEADGKGAGAAGRIGQALRERLSPIAFDQAVAVGRMLAEGKTETSKIARRWLQASELTCARAALVLSGDLEGAIRLLEADDQTSLLPREERLLDLIRFSVSDAYASVRAQISGATDRGGARRERSASEERQLLRAI